MIQRAKPLSIIHLEDNPADAMLIGHVVQKEIPDCRIEHVETAEAYRAALSDGRDFDLILSDYRMPLYDGDQALHYARKHRPEIPFIMVTGELGEDRAIETLKRGATDYVLKDNLKRLVPSIRRALEEAGTDRQRRRAEEALRQRTEELQAIMEAVPAAVFITRDPECLTVSGNRAAREMVELPADANMSKTAPEEERPTGWHELREGVSLAPSKLPLQQAARGKEVRDYEMDLVFRDGAVKSVSGYATPLKDEDGNPQGAVAVLIDVTERKQMEVALQEQQKQLSLIIETAMDGIVTLDADRRITLFNDAAEAMFGYTAREVIGEQYSILMPDLFRKAHHGQIIRFGEPRVTPRPAGNLIPNVTGRRKSGEEFPIEASISRGALGGTKFFTVIMRDVTERQRAEQERQRMNEELERRIEERTRELAAANQELESFSYSVSHDLKAPLRAIMGFSRILQEESGSKLSDEEQRHLEAIATGASNMNHLVEDILTFSRLGKHKLKTTLVNTDALMRSVIREQPVDPDREVQVTICDLPSIYADQTLLRQVLCNLVSNAFKFTRHTRHAHIEIASFRNETGEAVFLVRDNGAGFDMQYAGKLFGVFQRLHNVQEYEGSGVGLAFSKRIIERHGGRMWAEGKLNEGATFYFSLPAF